MSAFDRVIESPSRREDVDLLVLFVRAITLPILHRAVNERQEDFRRSDVEAGPADPIRSRPVAS
jgi:hypothetical protein